MVVGYGAAMGFAAGRLFGCVRAELEQAIQAAEMAEHEEKKGRARWAA